MSITACHDPAVDSPCPPAEVGPATQTRLITATEIRFSEIISALSVALDITQGYPEGH